MTSLNSVAAAAHRRSQQAIANRDFGGVRHEGVTAYLVFVVVATDGALSDLASKGRHKKFTFGKYKTLRYDLFVISSIAVNQESLLSLIKM